MTSTSDTQPPDRPHAAGDLAQFDATCHVGRRMALDASVPQEPDEVLDTLRACGISRALVAHSWSEEYDPTEGNARMADLARERREFEPCALLTPELAGPELPRWMAAWGARAARLRPAKHSFSLTPAVADTLLGQLAEMGTLVLISFGETDWERLDAVLSRHPALRVLLDGVGYRHGRSLYPMLERHEGLHVSMASLVGHREIETIVERFGPSRLLFGTGFPEITPGPTATRLRMAEVDDEAKRAIGGANLLRLLGDGGPR